ncbi:DUF4376 domain-containing protein [Gallibacterium salpingitidis]|uniref:DUF4376 domain-containing protein n=1 Tax=Gallibacterium salpingitidis TaxID=505341 RepID=UPI0009EF0C75|nr:DUF4376 domain-containing protein [Gallibacterium salpingitidis]
MSNIPYLIIIDKQTGKRETSFPEVPPDTKESLYQMATELYPEHLHLYDKTGEIQNQLINQDSYWLNGKVEKRPSHLYDWDGSKWVLNEQKQAELLFSQKSRIWESIKEYRYNRSLGGVYIKSVDRWFQTGEEEKTKYLGLSQVIDKIGSIEWKTFENDFVEMTPDLLAEIFAEMVRAENADHINAERHKAAMMQSDKPLDYDFSTGWERRYED